MKIFKNINFEKRVMLAVVIPMLIAITIIFPYFLYERINAINSNLYESGTRLSQHIVNISQHALSYGDKTYLNEMVSQMMLDIEELQSIRIIDEDGEIFFGPISKSENQHHHTPLKFLSPVELTIYPINTYDLEDEISFDDDSTTINNTQKTTIGYIELHISKADAIIQRNKIIAVYVCLTIMAVFIGYVCARMLGSSVSRPINKVIKTVSNLRKGQYSDRVNLNSGDELGKLANNINRLAHYLEKTRDRRLSEIEKLSKAQKAATDANRAKSEFLASMSHELRHPLTAIIGFLPTLKRINDNDHAKKLLDIIDIQANKLCRRIDEILQFEQIELNRVKFVETYFNIETEIKSIIKWHTEKAQSNNTVLSYHIEQDDGLDDIEIYTDQIHFQTIFDNLVGNAIKFTQNGSVYVYTKLNRIEDSKLKVNIEIQDTGIGIPKEQLENIFKPFEQIDKSTSRQYQGVGLGLHITKRIIDLMKGTIEVESRPQRGSIFTVDLPFSFQRPTEKSTAQKVINTTKTSNETILHVEDDLTIQAVVENMLEPKKIKVDACDNATEGFTLFRTRKYPAVLIDLHMPGMDGFELAEKIRNHETNSQKKVQRTTLIALTADVTEEATEKCFRSGFDNILHKPFKEEELVSAVLAAIEIYKRFE